MKQVPPSWLRSDTRSFFAKITLDQGFSNGSLGPPWSHRAVLWTATSRGLHYVALP